MAAPEVRMTAIRHGETTLGAQGRLTGRLDPPLTEHGRLQASALAPALASVAWDRRIHSGALRCRDTLALALRLPPAASCVTAEPRLLERAYGCLEGRRSSGWAQPADVDASPPGGESYRQLGLRVLAVVTDLLECSAREGRPLRVVVCAHSGVLRMLRAIEEGESDPASLLAPGPRPAETLELRYAGVAVPALFS